MTEPSQNQTQHQSTPPAHEVNKPLAADLPNPKLRLHINDLRHPGTKAFLSLIPDLESVLESALKAIIQNLYTVPSSPPTTKHPPHLPIFHPSIPPTRSVTILLRDISGVAYTTGTELDDSHKEIHISLPYIHSTSTRPGITPASELRGVLTHELVHCYQHTAPPRGQNGHDLRPPGGLIEGIADFVRLKASLAPPHWKRPGSARDRPERWDQGYQHTAYFLAWLEDVRVGGGAVGMVNDRLLRVGYWDHDEGEVGGDEGRKKGFWEGLFGERVEVLWREYGVYLDRLGGVMEEGDREGKMSTTWEEEIVDPE
ncbi:basic secretory family protein [Aspergillus melleus]|uniref:basic secretory family protein n=1 Tax=Aspergillus melleus TaxID=138277 RepID=UPI001E8EA9F4|nr:uncharacterized protein LDX57_003923 [Aspergillus melleus]KAH8426179.1 hypothetical protein LDX57_003923 [Aspergillus melleus]